MRGSIGSVLRSPDRWAWKSWRGRGGRREDFWRGDGGCRRSLTRMMLVGERDIIESLERSTGGVEFEVFLEVSVAEIALHVFVSEDGARKE